MTHVVKKSKTDAEKYITENWDVFEEASWFSEGLDNDDVEYFVNKRTANWKESDGKPFISIDTIYASVFSVINLLPQDTPIHIITR